MKISALCACLLLTLSASTFASERPDHYKREPSATIEEALNNLSSYNQKLAKLLEKDNLSALEMHEVHQLTYTLENALQRLDKEVDNLAATLEAVHLASETADTQTVSEQGKAYLEKAGQLTQ